MARRERHTKIGGQFSARLIEMLESPAYRVLSLSAHRVLTRLEIEHAHHGGTQNGELPVLYDDFQRYGIERHSIYPAIQEVVALGFVEITQEGRAGNAEFRRPTLYRLTYRPTKYAKPTEDWRKIETVEDALVAARTARQKNRNPVGVFPKTQWGNPTENTEIHSGKTHTTCLSGDFHTTLEISGRGHTIQDKSGAAVIPLPRTKAG